MLGRPKSIAEGELKRTSSVNHERIGGGRNAMPAAVLIADLQSAAVALLKDRDEAAIRMLLAA